MPEIGDRAPAFRVLNQDGQPVQLADFAGRRVVLYFFPRANTPG
jgi:peroxiredoxin Q/BCP